MSFDPKGYLHEIAGMDDDEIDLAKAAIALAALRQPDVSLDRYFNHLHKLSEEVRGRHEELIDSGADDDVDTQLAALKHIIIDKHAYEGVAEKAAALDVSYYIDGASLIRVIDSGKGVPVALSIIFIHTGRTLGWGVDGLDVPGRFVCRLEKDGQRVIFDPADQCRKLEASDLRAFIKEEVGPHAEILAAYFEPMGARRILIRLQNNIKFRQIEMEDYQEALKTVEGMRQIDPDEYRLLLDAGVLYARTEQTSAAIEVLEEYIKRAPYDRDRHDAALLLQQLKDALA